MPGSRRVPPPRRPGLIEKAIAGGRGAQLPIRYPGAGGRAGGVPGRSLPITPPRSARPPMPQPGPRHPIQVPGAGPGIIAFAQQAANPPAPPAAPPATGPYQGAAGSEEQNAGRPRTPMPDWADPSSPNYERRNYYIHPGTGQIVAREPGYYNPDNPYDTGRPGESNMEFFRTYGWKPELERRMDEPGITPWGPGGKAGKPGAFPAPPGAAPAAGVRHPVPNPLLDSLLGGPTKPVDTSQIGLETASDVSDPFRPSDPTQALLLALSQMLTKLPGRRPVRNAE